MPARMLNPPAAWMSVTGSPRMAQAKQAAAMASRKITSEEKAAGSFNFKLASLKPYESKDAVAPLTTKLKPYELPDWQNVSTEVQITSP